MRLNLELLLSLVLVVLLVVSAKRKGSTASKKSSDAEKDSDSGKIAHITKLLSASPVVSLSDKNFTKYVTERPRDYHAILMFTATGPQYQCGVCVRSLGSYEEIAKFYNDQYEFNKTAIEKKVVFFKLEVDNSRQVFNELQLETVPRLFFLPPMSVDAPKVQIQKFEVDNKVLLEGTSRILEEIHHITGVKVILFV